MVGRLDGTTRACPRSGCGPRRSRARPTAADPDALRVASKGAADRALLHSFPEVPEGSRRPEIDDGAPATRFALRRGRVRGAARPLGGPLLLVIDDLHWATRHSLRCWVPRYDDDVRAAPRSRRVPGTHETPSTGPGRAARPCTRPSVHRSASPSVLRLLASQHRLHATRADAQRVADRTGGNPLLRRGDRPAGRRPRARRRRGPPFPRARGDDRPTSSPLSQPAADVLGTRPSQARRSTSAC